MRRLFIVLISISVTCIKAQDIQKIDLDNPPQNYMVWTSESGTNRVWNGEIYLVTDAKGIVLNEFPQFKFVDDYKEGLALVQTKFNKCGFIDLSGKIVVSPKYNTCQPSSGGFALVQDRYEDWYLVDQKGLQINLAFESATNILGYSRAVEKGGKELYINLSKVNFGYYHPLMKALEKVNDIPVKSQFIESEGKIVYKKIENGEIAFELSI